MEIARLTATALVAVATLVSVSHAEVIELRFAHPYTGIPVYSQAYNEMVERFNEEHPDIRVVVEDFPQGSGSHFDRILTAVVSGTAPDVVHIWGMHNAVLFYESGLAVDLTEFVSRASWYRENNFIPALLDWFRYEERIIGLPGSESTAAILFTNNNLIEESGLDSGSRPGDLFELLNMVQLLVRRNADGTPSQLGMAVPGLTWNWMLQVPAWFGLDIWDPEAYRVILTSPEMMHASEWLLELYRIQGGYNPITQVFPDANEAFVDGKIAMTLSHPHLYNNFIAARPDVTLGDDIMLWPAIGAPNTDGAPLAATDATIVLTTTQHPEAAYRFAEYIAIGEGAYFACEKLHCVPPRIDLARSLVAAIESVEDKIIYDALLPTMLRARSMSVFSEFTFLANELGKAYTSALREEVPISQALWDVENRVQARMDEIRRSR